MLKLLFQPLYRMPVTNNEDFGYMNNSYIFLCCKVKDFVVYVSYRF